MPPPESWPLDPAGQDIAAQHLRRQAEESSMLQSKVAQLEAHLRRQSMELARRTPSPTFSPRASPGRRPRTPSPIMEPHHNNSESIDQLKQMNPQLMAQLATASQLVSSVLCTLAVDHRCPVPLASQPEAKPFNDWIPQGDSVDTYSGEASRAPVRRRRLSWPSFVCMRGRTPFLGAERARELINGPAQLWYTLTLANDPTTAIEAQTALGLCKALQSPPCASSSPSWEEALRQGPQVRLRHWHIGAGLPWPPGLGRGGSGPAQGRGRAGLACPAIQRRVVPLRGAVHLLLPLR